MRPSDDRGSMFTKTAEYYDLIYSFKNYASEAKKIDALIKKEHLTARSILDVACGTAEHAKLLAQDFSVDGIDLEPKFIQAAQRKVPSGNFSVADMRQFELGKKYDVVQCLFSSIA
jgi:ubiquinone/menaquinone biosynthesis C-methylase UbiE